MIRNALLAATAVSLLMGCSAMDSIQSVAMTDLGGEWKGDYQCQPPRWLPHPSKATVTFIPGALPMTFTGHAEYVLTDYRTGKELGGNTTFTGKTQLVGSFALQSETFVKRWGPNSDPSRLSAPLMKGRMVDKNTIVVDMCDTKMTLHRTVNPTATLSSQAAKSPSAYN
ncbi:hypothetical protein SAMN05216296_1978 [Pseudomonas pohangensis]|uniref:Lipoprotein n=1 Tax=Pseudomonas pohangensis TaxID=364197 RepID=A0A1H2G1Y3_9PSED|nr:hypothetical protein [Pseudomonas pohangensis]SDU13602.1 hypothetical protein SAMN05216296_1978 [Pseudomonas pohangensis]